jgi:hypothetical protein
VKLGVDKERPSPFDFRAMHDLDRENAINSEGAEMLANTDADNIPVSLGIYPRSEKYKGFNGGRDTNNETFHSSPEPRQSASAGSDDTPTRDRTDYWR